MPRTPTHVELERFAREATTTLSRQLAAALVDDADTDEPHCVQFRRHVERRPPRVRERMTARARGWLATHDPGHGAPGPLGTPSLSSALTAADPKVDFDRLLGRTPEPGQGSYHRPAQVTSSLLMGTFGVEWDPAAVGHGNPLFDEIELVLHRITCLDETNEAGGDEIALGGICGASGSGERPGGTRAMIGRLSVEDVHTGRTMTPQRPLMTIPAHGDAWPKYLWAQVGLAEIDAGGFGDFLDSLWTVTERLVRKAIQRGFEALGGAIGGPLGAAIGALAGYIVGQIVGWIIRSLKDDIFAPQLVDLVIHDPRVTPAPVDRFGVIAARTLTFEDHSGKYQVVVEWRARGALSRWGRDHLYTVGAGEYEGLRGWVKEGVIGHVLTEAATGTHPLFRLYSGAAVDHFYTTSHDEKTVATTGLGFADEGALGYLYAEPGPGRLPLYRLYAGGRIQDHFYTVHAAERAYAEAHLGYRHEAVIGYVLAEPSRAPKTRPVYRAALPMRLWAWHDVPEAELAPLAKGSLDEPTPWARAAMAWAIARGAALGVPSWEKGPGVRGVWAYAAGWGTASVSIPMTALKLPAAPSDSYAAFRGACHRWAVARADEGWATVVPTGRTTGNLLAGTLAAEAIAVPALPGIVEVKIPAHELAGADPRGIVLTGSGLGQAVMRWAHGRGFACAIPTSTVKLTGHFPTLAVDVGAVCFRGLTNLPRIGSAWD